MTGPNAAGKGAVADYLARRGFAVHSLSDIVREEARGRGLPPEREHLIEVGNDLRHRHGPAVLAQRIASRLGRRNVVDSIRNPAEVRALRALPGFVLIGIRAAVETRFRRMLDRGRPGDPLTLDEFRLREEQENTSDPAAQQLRETFAMADLVLDNDGSLAALQAGVDRFLEASAARRPD